VREGKRERGRGRVGRRVCECVQDAILAGLQNASPVHSSICVLISVRLCIRIGVLTYVLTADTYLVCVLGTYTYLVHSSLCGTVIYRSVCACACGCACVRAWCVCLCVQGLLQTACMRHLQARARTRYAYVLILFFCIALSSSARVRAMHAW